MTRPACEDCRHSALDLAANTPAGVLDCRAHPPQVFLVPSPQGIGFLSQWPKVRKEHACGEFVNGKVLLS